jgi:uncharacterized membrane protein YhhN
VATSSAAPYVVNFFDALNAYKIAVLLYLVFSLFMVIPDQSLELYRYTAQSFAEWYHSCSDTPHACLDNLRGLIETIVVIVSLCLLSVSFLLLVALLRSLRTHQQNTNMEYADSFLSLIVSTPYLAVSIGVAHATIQMLSPDLKSHLLLGATLSLERENGESSPFLTELANFVVDDQLRINHWLYLFAALLFAFFIASWVASHLMLTSVSLTNFWEKHGNHLIVWPAPGLVDTRLS